MLGVGKHSLLHEPALWSLHDSDNGRIPHLRKHSMGFYSKLQPVGDTLR